MPACLTKNVFSNRSILNIALRAEPMAMSKPIPLVNSAIIKFIMLAIRKEEVSRDMLNK